jgi:uncharacterized membrane protein
MTTATVNIWCQTVLTATVNTYYVIKAVHVMCVLATFGVAFVYPIAFAVVSRHDPRSLPALHRIEYRLQRTLIVPGLLVVVLTGVDITAIAKHWGQFFVQWGLGAALAIGVLVTVFMIPTAERAAAVAQRDVVASAGGTVSLSAEYRTLARRLLLGGTLLSGIVLVTILFMAVGLKL